MSEYVVKSKLEDKNGKLPTKYVIMFLFVMMLNMMQVPTQLSIYVVVLIHVL